MIEMQIISGLVSEDFGDELEFMIATNEIKKYDAVRILVLYSLVQNGVNSDFYAWF